MKKGIFLLIILCLFELHITQTSAQTISTSNNLVAQPIPDRIVSFSVSDTGIYRSVLWGMDAGGWTNPAIWTLGARFLGAETINITRMPAFPVTKNYSFTDATPVEGANYYRIQQIDKNGHFTFSIVRTLSFASLPFIITITPNPVKEMILASAPGNNKSLQAVLLNSAGQKVDAFTIKGQNTTYNLSHHAAGVYYLQIQGADVKISKKLIIDR